MATVSLCLNRRCADIANSPEDKDVLEAAYQQNPKPGKNTRLHIVQHVSMNEKQVQVRTTQLSSRLCLLTARFPLLRSGFRTAGRQSEGEGKVDNLCWCLSDHLPSLACYVR